MNRRDRANQKKKKRDEKRRAVRRESAGAREPAGGAVPDAGALSGDSLPSKLARTFAGGRREDAVVEAAAVAGEVMDDAMALVWSVTDDVPACARGCSYCCHLPVTVTVPEVARVATHARAHLPPELLARVAERARDNAAQTHGKAALDYPARLPCALLGDDGACLVYDARPLMCRREHSLEVTDCKLAFDGGDGGGMEDDVIAQSPTAMALGSSTFETYQASLATAKVDGALVELQEALHIALSNDDAVASWLAGGPAFASARMAEAPAATGVGSSLVPLRRRRGP